MKLTDYQAKYLAWELTKRCPSDSFEKLAGGSHEGRFLYSCIYWLRMRIRWFFWLCWEGYSPWPRSASWPTACWNELPRNWEAGSLCRSGVE